MGEKVSGIIGYDLLSKCLAEIRLADEKIFVHKLVADPVSTLSWQPLKLDRRLPLLPARVNDLPVELFRIDVGASGLFFSNVVFHTPFTKSQNLAGQFGSEEFSMLPPHEFSTGTIPRFEFGGKTFVDAHAGFATSDTAPFNDVYSKGNIGVEFLMPFVIVLDYSTRVIQI